MSYRLSDALMFLAGLLVLIGTWVWLSHVGRIDRDGYHYSQQ